MKMKLFLYFSGTGNTKYVVNKVSDMIKNSKVISIEENVDFKQLIEESEEITICYPIYTSMMPKLISDFLLKHKKSFKNKIVNTIVTQMMFSGDGAAMALRELKEENIITKYSIHFSMPNNISDVKMLRFSKVDKIQRLLQKKDEKITKYISKINKEIRISHGRRFYSRILAYTLQRSFGPWFHRKYEKKWQVEDSCILCNLCVTNCPVDNLFLKDNKINSNDNCILCYRCVNICPTKSIHIIGKATPKDQYYLS